MFQVLLAVSFRVSGWVSPTISSVTSLFMTKALNRRKKGNPMKFHEKMFLNDSIWVFPKIGVLQN